MTIITIVAAGTRGDVQPYIALGQGLQRAGYSVRLLTTANFESLATDAGLEFHSTGSSVEELLQSDEWRKLTEGGNFLKILGGMQRELKHRAAEQAQIVPPLIAGSDLMITGVGGLGGGFSIADKLNIPVIQAYVFPFTPTSTFATPLVPRLPIGGPLNRLSFHATHQMFWQSTKAGDAATRAALHMGRGSGLALFRSLARGNAPVMYGYSGHVLPRPHDWPANHHVTGYWFLDAPDAWTPPADLLAFLDAGAPPVYIGFGSMGSRDPEQAAQIALEALRLSGQRGVLSAGWGGLKPTDLPETVHLVGSLPHTWLFQRMGAVVHHGGAGTTAAGLRSGVPSIVVPFMADQPFWGARVHDLGVGPQPIARKKLTAQRLADAISDSMTSAAMRQRAEALGRAIRAEDGVGNAVAHIDAYLEHALHAPA